MPTANFGFPSVLGPFMRDEELGIPREVVDIFEVEIGGFYRIVFQVLDGGAYPLVFDDPPDAV